MTFKKFFRVVPIVCIYVMNICGYKANQMLVSSLFSSPLLIKTLKHACNRNTIALLSCRRIRCCHALLCTGKRKREVGLILPSKFQAMTKNARLANVVNNELHKLKEKYTHFDFTFGKSVITKVPYFV